MNIRIFFEKKIVLNDIEKIHVHYVSYDDGLLHINAIHLNVIIISIYNLNGA